jgi:hypothetical protein
MLMRLGLVVALILGLGDMSGWLPFSPKILWVHVAAGLAVLLGVAALAIQTRSGRMWLALLIALIGAAFGILVRAQGGPYDGFIHLGLMLAAVGIAEMTPRPRRQLAWRDRP